MSIYSKQSGYSLVEALVAIAVLLIAMVGPMTIAAQGIKSSRFALEQNTAFFLAQEGVETVFRIRDNYALEDIDNDLTPGTDTSYNWLKEVLHDLGPCASDFGNNNDSCTLGIDFRDGELYRTGSAAQSNFTSAECVGSDVSQCLLYLDESRSFGKYSHVSSGGSPTSYSRTIEITRRAEHSVEVTSTVTWDSTVFPGQPQTVTLTTFLSDSNYE